MEHAQSLKIGQQITLLWPKRVLNRNFTLAREISHDHEFAFHLLEYDDLLSRMSLVTFYDDFDCFSK